MAQAIPALITAAVTAGTAAAVGGGPKINVPPPIQRDDAAATVNANDALAKRRGGASDILNGDAGFTQPLPGPKTTLGA